jgi:hypothetical protein
LCISHENHHTAHELATNWTSERASKCWSAFVYIQTAYVSVYGEFETSIVFLWKFDCALHSACYQDA